VEILLEESEV